MGSLPATRRTRSVAGRNRSAAGSGTAPVRPPAARLLAVQQQAGNRAARFVARSSGRVAASGPAPLRRQAGGTGSATQQAGGACAAGTEALTSTAASWINTTIAALAPLTARGPSGGRQGGTAPAASAVRSLFATSDPAYVRLLRARLRHMAGALAGRVSITCGGSGCRTQGSGFVSAYVARPYELVMCSPRPTAALAKTFVHELAHATLPDVGVRRSVGGEGVTDRAYTHERLFGRLTTEEALDNAESYGQLVAVLGGGAPMPTAPSRRDTVSDPAHAEAVRGALAHTEVWVRVAEAQLHAVGQALGRAGAASDPQVRQARTLIGVTTAAEATAAKRLLQELSSHLRNSVHVDVAAGSGSTLGTVGRTSFTASGPGPRQRRAGGAVTVTPAWVAADALTRRQALFALVYLRKHPSQQPTRAWQLATFARAVAARRLPSTAGRTSGEHRRREARFEALEDRARWFRGSASHAAALRQTAQRVGAGDRARAASLLRTSLGQARVQSLVRALLSVHGQGRLGLDASDPEVVAARRAYRRAVRAHHRLMNAAARLAPIAGGALMRSEQAARIQTSRLISRAARAA